MRLDANLLLPAFLGSTSALVSLQQASPSGGGQLFIADRGVGHRSRPVPQWRTSLRGLDTAGTGVRTIIEFGASVGGPSMSQPIDATSLAFDPKKDHVYVATGAGIIRSNLDGSDYRVVVNESSTAIALSEGKLYYGVMYDGLIKRSNLDGSGVEMVLNVSQGINYPTYPTSYMPANSFPDGILIDEENEFIYWSASRGPDDGSIRRAPLEVRPGLDSQDAEVLVKNINMPGQLRFVNKYLYWVEKGRWYNSPTAIKRAKFPPSKIALPDAVATNTLVHSNQSSIFFDVDSSGDNNTLSIQSFVIDADAGKLWFAMKSDSRTMFAGIVVTGLEGGELKVLNKNATEIGIPVGLEYVK